MATPGLGSDNMSEEDKERIHSEGGKASKGGGNSSRSTSTGKGDVTTNNSGGGAIDKDAQRKGGHNSHKND